MVIEVLTSFTHALLDSNQDTQHYYQDVQYQRGKFLLYPWRYNICGEFPEEKSPAMLMLMTDCYHNRHNQGKIFVICRSGNFFAKSSGEKTKMSCTEPPGSYEQSRKVFGKNVQGLGKK